MWHIPFRNLRGQTNSLLLWGREIVKSLCQKDLYWWNIWPWVKTCEDSWYCLPWWIHFKVWCPGWNQWCNSSQIVDGFWLRWWHCIGYELSKMDSNKIVLKLCNNNTATKKRQDGCNPRYIFDYIWRFLIHNVNFITKHAKLYLCGDDISWETDCNGEAGGWANRPNLEQSWYHKGRPDSPGKWRPTHKATYIQVQVQFLCEASWVECTGKYWSDVNHGGDEAGGGKIGGWW